MSAPSNLVEWFQQNFRREYYLQEEISRRAEEIFRQLPVPSPQGSNTVPIRIELAERPEGGLTLVMNDLGIVYVGALSSAILESLKAELEGLLSSEIGSSVIRDKVREVLLSDIVLKHIVFMSSNREIDDDSDFKLKSKQSKRIAGILDRSLTEYIKNMPKLNFLVFGPGIGARYYKSHRLAVKHMIMHEKGQNADFPEEVDDTLKQIKNRSSPSYINEILANPATKELIMARGYDCIIIPMMNMGPIAEFSRFAGDALIAPRIRLFIPDKHAKSKGFVNTGPVKAFKDAYNQVKTFKNANELLRKVGKIVDSLVVMRIYQAGHSSGL